MCDFNCLDCKEIDCNASSGAFPVEDLDVYMQFDLDKFQRAPIEFFCFRDCVCISNSSGEETDREETDRFGNDLRYLLDPRIRAWCDSKNVVPHVQADISILEKAYTEGFTGKKLEKALYKVRHRDKYLASKRRNNLRRSGKLNPFY